MVDDKIVILNSHAAYLRDLADRDYIAARSLYRLGLIDHFMWNSLQCLEKYLKATLLFNQIDARKFGHVTIKIIDKIEKHTIIKYHLLDKQIHFLKRIESYADRYFNIPKYSMRFDLSILDSCVWKIRGYCQYINISVGSGDKTKDISKEIIEMIQNRFYVENPHKFLIVTGLLEQLMNNRSNADYIPLRDALVWNNTHYGNRRRRIFRHYVCRSASSFPPHFDDPARKKILSDYIKLK